MSEPGQQSPILFIEDDESVREVIGGLLEAAGYEVATARNGREALEYLQGPVVPRLILLDLLMPVMNGWQFLAEQQRDPRLADLPVVVLTGADHSSEEHPDLLELPPVILTKPVFPDVLFNVVRRYCGAGAVAGA